MKPNSKTTQQQINLELSFFSEGHLKHPHNLIASVFVQNMIENILL